MTTTTRADADADTNAPRQLQKQQQLLQQQWRNGKRWGVSTSKDIRGASVGCFGGKQRPGNGGNDNRGGIVPAAGEFIGDPGGRRGGASPPCDRLLRGDGVLGGPAARRGAGPKRGYQG
jgi:hypothetical protein